MKTNSLRDMRELTGKEVTSVAGGLLGEIPGYHVSLPDSLFVNGAICFEVGGQPGGACMNTYPGGSYGGAFQI